MRAAVPREDAKKNRMVVVDDYPIRRTMKYTNRDEFKNFLDYVPIRHSYVVEVGEKLVIFLLQGRL